MAEEFAVDVEGTEGGVGGEVGAPYGEGGSVGFGIVVLRLRCAVFLHCSGGVVGLRWAIVVYR